MVKMVVNINPSSKRFDESVRVLKLTAAITDQISSVDKSNYEAEKAGQASSSKNLTVAWDSGKRSLRFALYLSSFLFVRS